MKSRRQFFAALGSASVVAATAPLVLFAGSCGPKGEEVSANEDLMREHGVLRRALLVYSLVAAKLRAGPASIAPAPIHDTAMLFRKFGEEYHERLLEEPFIFPAVKNGDSELARYVEILLEQHQRGREITDFILSQTAGTKLDQSGGLPEALESFVLMYQEHTAREDTVIFPAWHKQLSSGHYDDMGDKFEDIERRQFGHDGFEDAVTQISRIEAQLNLADLAQFTASAPPKI